ncbi:GNAT family N-acetyltransferase [Alicyclobacillus fastidiosus]|uniref:GNAT family N-acetyltransferase n=1 Tax=Alicyclobacillus fastidiosus TaxID=392011 RepID=A0ABY6ZL74_9BACL|nr:GNAT family N-acetyltransferase [Alicyclobacillus fastidiosus]WAH43658.1 GNAT family N-acetyltransferase [Alicyclobacillus fastidiosus]GMA59858.1 putative acetyltransferase YjbC [Alicyclobacillus fastidiosus]
MSIVKDVPVPSYYRKLASYFPAHEMKHVRQLQALVEDVPYYGLLETREYLVLYGDFSDFLFIDYLLVNRDQRGSGVGSRLLKQLQSRHVPILLEVEPVDPNDVDTEKRRRFYERNGFAMAHGVQYEREDRHGEPYTMDLLYWSPSQKISDDRVLRMMTTVCHRIHNYRAMQFYDRIPAQPEEVLSLVK